MIYYLYWNVKKRVRLFSLVLVSIILLSLFSVSVIAVDGDEVVNGGDGFDEVNVEDSEEGSCEDYCDNFWMSATPGCPGEPRTSGEFPDCDCGWECFDDAKKNDDDDFDFDDDDDYRCEDMNQNDCENAKSCEGIFGPSFCEGDICTSDEAWKGCRYEGDEFFEDYKDEELKVDAGTTPGSAFYFIDKFFDKFGDELEVKEERIAEIKAMVEIGDLESAKIALKDYMELADELEHDIDPERKEEAKRSAAAIRATMKDIRDQLPPGERGKFVREIMSKEHSIATAVEISSKIKELCVQLAELDPLEYSKMCKTDDGDAPDWKKKLDRDLSEEQEKTARKFVNIMKQCFKSSGKDCKCEEIPFYDFSIACSKAAPLAMACDVDGDEIACDELDNLDMPELPEWLQPIWEDLESGMNEAQYDMHMPKECIEAGVTNPKECGRVMIKEHSPLECRAALLEADVQSEMEGRKICDKIMFDLHSPKECNDKGITDPNECMKFMDSFRGPGGPMDGGFGKGPDCMSIEDSTKRLECYDNKGNEFGEHYGPGPGFEGEGELTWQCRENRIHDSRDCEDFMSEKWPEQERMKREEGDMRREQEGDWRVKEKECAASCDLENGWWDFKDGECVCKAGDFEDYKKPGDYDNQESGCNDCSSQCPPGANTDCVNNQCVCGDVPDTSPQYAPGEGPGEPGDFDNNGDAPIDNGGEVAPPPADSGGDAPVDAGITGNVFLDYMNR